MTDKVKKIAQKTLAVCLALAMVFALAACGGSAPAANNTASNNAAPEKKSYSVGICNYVDDASLNQIVDNIKAQLEAIAKEKGVEINVKYDNCNADANVLAQIITNFKDVDVMIGVATPVAIAMQGATEDSKQPVVFAAVSEPVDCNLVKSFEAPGSNITGTSDQLNTEAVLNLMLSVKSDIKKVGLLYDVGQDSSTASIAAAKAFLASKNIEVVEKNGRTVDEVVLAAKALVEEKVEAVFTPTDNTIMTAELSIYEIFADAGILHYAGADSFALNGAFLGYGVNYAILGKETANLAAQIMLEGKDPGTIAVKTFDNGIATVNTDICKKLGLAFDDVKATLSEKCSEVLPIETAESFK